MPIYEYRCSSCGKELEALQKLSDAPLKTCPACHADTLVKLVSAAGFQLKGSGWYATDFKGSGGKPAAKKDSGESATESKTGKGDAASESKSESKGGKDTAGESKSESKAEAKTDTKAAGTTPSSGTGSPPAST